MKKSILLLLFCFPFILSACSQSVEDTQEYSGIISDGEFFGYEYSVTKEQTKFIWKVGYKGETAIIEKSANNQDDLENYKNAVDDSKLVFGTLIISLAYILIVIISTLILYKKNRKMLKDASVIMVLLTGIAVYIAFDSSLDLSRVLKDAQYYYLTLTN